MAVALLCLLFAFLPLLLLVGSVVLRTAVSVSNAFRGARPGPPGGDRDDLDPDARPAEPIPMPSLERGLGITLVNGLYGLAVVVIVRSAVVVKSANPLEQEMTRFAVNAISAPIGFLISCAVLSAMLPTPFARAALVTAMQYAIAILTVVAVVAMSFGFAFAMKAA